MKRISRREFHRLAAIGAVSGALAHASPQPQAPQTQSAPPKPPTKVLLTAEQEKKVGEKVAERDQDMAGLRSRNLPYTLEPAFVFRARVPQRRPATKG
jgi:hypothetical protein